MFGKVSLMANFSIKESNPLVLMAKFGIRTSEFGITDSKNNSKMSKKSALIG